MSTNTKLRYATSDFNPLTIIVGDIVFDKRFIPYILSGVKILTARTKPREKGIYNAVCAETGEVFAQIKMMNGKPSLWQESDFQDGYLSKNHCERFGFPSSFEMKSYYHRKGDLYVHHFELVKKGATK